MAYEKKTIKLGESFKTQFGLKVSNKHAHFLF